MLIWQKSPPVPWAWVDEHVYAAIRGCSVKVLQNERRLEHRLPVHAGSTAPPSDTSWGTFGSSWNRSRGAGRRESEQQSGNPVLAGRAVLRLDCFRDRSDECGVGRDSPARAMSVFKNGRFYHYEFVDGRRHRGSTGTATSTRRSAEERRQRERLEKSYSQIIEEEAREQRRKTIKEAADEFLEDYTAKHESPTFAEYALGHVKEPPG